MKTKCTLLVLALASFLVSCQNSPELDNQEKKNSAVVKDVEVGYENPDSNYEFYSVAKYPTNPFYPSEDSYYGIGDVKVTKIAVSPDGEYMALLRDGEPNQVSWDYGDYVFNNIFLYKVNKQDNTISLVQPQTGLEQDYADDFIMTEGETVDIAYLPNNWFLLVGDDQVNVCTIRVFGVNDNGTLYAPDQADWFDTALTSYPLTYPARPVFSKDGKYLAFAEKSGIDYGEPGVWLYLNRGDAESTPSYKRLRDFPSTLLSCRVLSCSISPKGDMLAAVKKVGASTVIISRIAGEQVVDDWMPQLPEHDYVDCSFSPDGKYLAISSADGYLVILKCNSYYSVDVLFEVRVPDGGKIKWAPETNIFGVLSGRELLIYRITGTELTSIAMSPNSSSSGPYDVSDFEFLRSESGQLTLYTVSENGPEDSMWGINQWEFVYSEE